MEDSTADPKPRIPAADGAISHGAERSGVTSHAVDLPGEHHGGRRHLYRGLPAALDGCVTMVIARDELRELRDVAARSDGPLADMLLAVFGLVLDRHTGHRETSIAILSADPGPPGRARQRGKGASENPGGAAMPLDMRLAIARGQAAVDPSPPTGRGVAFRHTRRGPAQEWIAPEPAAGQAATRQDKGDFDLILDIGEFDDMLLVECFFRTRATSIRSVEWLVRDYAHALQAIVKSFDSAP